MLIRLKNISGVDRRKKKKRIFVCWKCHTLHLLDFILNFSYWTLRFACVNWQLSTTYCCRKFLNYDHISESRKIILNFSIIRSLGIRDTYKVCTYKRILINNGLLICRDSITKKTVGPSARVKTGPPYATMPAGGSFFRGNTVFLACHIRCPQQTSHHFFSWSSMSTFYYASSTNVYHCMGFILICYHHMGLILIWGYDCRSWIPSSYAELDLIFLVMNTPILF